jgi:hypothetical protein
MGVERRSRIDGAFTGWTGDGIYTLVDRSRWQQVRYRYRYRYRYRPYAQIIRRGGRLFLAVDGMDDEVEVRRVSELACPSPSHRCRAWVDRIAV